MRAEYKQLWIYTEIIRVQPFGKEALSVITIKFIYRAYVDLLKVLNKRNTVTRALKLLKHTYTFNT